MRRYSSIIAASGIAAAALTSPTGYKLGPNIAASLTYAEQSRAVMQSQAAKNKEISSYIVAKNGNLVVSTSIYDRMDEKMLQTSRFKTFAKGHALHETLRGERKIETWEIYRKKGTDEIMAIIKFGEAVNGHPGIVHGGIISLLFDDCFGWVFFCLNKPMSVTANLNINFRKPLKQNTTTVLRAKMTKEEGRKMFMDATLHEAAAEGEETLLADSSTLFIKVKLPFWKQLYLKFFP